MGAENQSITVEVVDIASDGMGVAKADGKVYFIEHTVIGDVVEILPLRRKKNAWQTRLLNIIQPSTDRIVPDCRYFGTCGGCKFQHIRYEAQLHFKQKQVEDALIRIGKLTIPAIQPILGCEQPFGYRNKVEFTFSSKRWLSTSEIQSEETISQSPALGFHVPQIFDKIVDIHECFLGDELVNAIRNRVREVALENQIPFYDIRNHTGLLRNLVLRNSPVTGERMVILILAYEQKPVTDLIFGTLEAEFPEITSFIQIINPKQNDSYSDLPFSVWKGKSCLTERLGEFEYLISPVSFFQTNTKQAEKLYQIVKNRMSKHEIVYDLYCGAGSIGIFVSALAKQIYGIEYVAKAVDDANLNCQQNQLSHLQFFAGNLAEVLTADFVQKTGKPDLIITDPPRAGMDPKVCKQLLEIESPKIIYVSCNPATQARDLQILSEKYEIVFVQPVDLFPQTAHVETVVELNLRSFPNE